MTLPFKALFVGTFRHNLDAKNRLTIPAKWRFAGDEKEVYLALPHPDGYVAVLPPTEIEKLYAKVAEKALSDRTAQDVLNRLFARAHSFGCDRQGRICLPEELLRHAGVTKTAVLTGSFTKFSIWSPAAWDELEKRTSGESLSDLMGRVGL